ncbi:MAG: hypothetical protein ABEJ31_07090 [Haloarculaceae archaeon]
MTDGRLTHAGLARLAALDPDTLDALAHPSRRLLVYELSSATGYWSVAEVAAAVRAADPRADADASAEDRRTEFYHRHLPKLDASGLVEFDREGERVRVTERGVDCAERLAAALN